MMTESLNCNIVLLPRGDLAGKAIAISHSLESEGVYFTLEDGVLYPHLSLYMFELKLANVDAISDILKRLAARYSEFNLEAHRYGQYAGYIEAEYLRTSMLDTLQDEVIATVNPLRNGLRQKDVERMERAEGLELENFQKYGYPYAYALFRPHITFTRFLTSDTRPTDGLLPISELDGSFDRIALCAGSDNGTCVRVIKEYELYK